MAERRGWWNLDYTSDPSDTDLEFVSRLVRVGYTAGQLLGEESPGAWSISFNVEPTEYDLEYVADWIAGGWRDGEIVQDEPNE